MTKVCEIGHFLDFITITEGHEELVGERVLVLSPHPDDESIACGGLIKLLTDAGTAIDVLFTTQGEKGVPSGVSLSENGRRDLKNTRVREAARAGAILGVRAQYYLNGRDGETFLQGDLWLELKEHLEAHDYSAVLCPWPYDSHSDHVTTFQMLASALEVYTKPLKIWLYEVWNPVLANRVVPIDRTIEKKLEAIRVYASQLECINYPEKIVGLNQYRSLLARSAHYAEAYLTCDREVVLKMRGHIPRPAPPARLKDAA